MCGSDSPVSRGVRATMLKAGVSRDTDFQTDAARRVPWSVQGRLTDERRSLRDEAHRHGRRRRSFRERASHSDQDAPRRPLQTVLRFLARLARRDYTPQVGADAPLVVLGQGDYIQALLPGSAGAAPAPFSNTVPRTLEPSDPSLPGTDAANSGDITDEHDD